MELHHDNRIFFDATSHSYLLDGETLLMGVTELMRKHNLGADYSGIPESVLKKAAEEGTAIHREIQEFEKGETVFASEFIDEYKKLNLRFVEAEYQVSDYELIASAIDCVYEGSKPNTAILVDYKTTQKFHRRPLEFQLGIYKVLFERVNPDIKVEGCYCLWIDKKARKINDFVAVNPVTEEEVNALLECERNGQIYIDTNNTPDLGEVLAPEEAAILAEHAGKIVELENTLKILKEADEQIRAKLVEYMEANNLSEVACTGGTFKLKAAYSTTRVDAKALKTLFPAVYEKVKTESQVKASLTFKQNQ